MVYRHKKTRLISGSLQNVVLLLTTTTKTSRAIILIGLLTNGRYVFKRECDCCHHSVVYMPVTKKSKKKAIKVAFLHAGYEFQRHSIVVVDLLDLSPNTFTDLLC